MRNLILIFVCGILSFCGFSQQTITENLIHNNLDREYIVYIPDSYDEDSKTPLLFNFHGYTSNATEQMGYGDFRAIADAEGFILVHPEGALYNGNTHWNVGGWIIGSTVDDVGFTEKMIEDISADYTIDPKRIYSTGMSNGGFMSFLLACQLSDKIAAVASVAGSMTPSTFNSCNAQHPTPVLYIHGNQDNVVPYDGAAWTKSVEDVIDFWKIENECDSDPVIENVPNTNTLDGTTAVLYSYLNCASDSEVIQVEILQGGHTWPGTIFNAPGTNQDFNASEIIWNFLSQYDIDGLINETTSVKEGDKDHSDVSIYPNPTSSELNIDFKETSNQNFELRNLSGQLMQKGKFTQKEEVLNLSPFPNGKYTLRIGDKSYNITKVE